MPLPRVKKEAPLTAFEIHPQARLQDDFAWRVKLSAHLILLLTFLIPGEKVRSASGRQIAPTEPAGETVPRRGMSGKRGAQGTFP